MNDLLDWIESELDRERAEAAAHIDRAEALVALRSHLLPAAATLRRPLTPDDLYASCSDERERAEVRALAERITGRGEPAIEVFPRLGHRVGSGVAF